MSFAIDDLLNIATVLTFVVDESTKVVTTHVQGLNDEDYGSIATFGPIGVICAPFPPNDAGRVEGLVCTTPNNQILIGCRDVRTSDVYGALKPGDTVMFSTGPEHAARILCKESSEVTLLSKDPDGDDCFITLNGGANAIQASIAGNGFELSKNAGAVLMTGGGYLKIDNDGKAVLNGSQVQLGNTQLGNMVVLSPTDLAALNAWLVALQATFAAIAAVVTTTPVTGVQLAGYFTTIAAITPPPFLGSTNVVG